MNQLQAVFRVRAHNSAAESENKIHDDRIAATYGFHGGLVPGVTMYGYIVPPVLEKFGQRWLECGRMTMRLHAPCYEGDMVVSRCDGSSVSAAKEDGTLYASGAVTLETGSGVREFSFPFRQPPEIDQRLIASSESIQPGAPLGSIRAALDVASVAHIPERLLRMANEILVRNFRMSPWIHAGSDVRHHRLAGCGEEITVSGMIQECFERKGRKFAVARIAMSGANSQLVATVHHTFIYAL